MPPVVRKPKKDALDRRILLAALLRVRADRRPRTVRALQRVLGPRATQTVLDAAAAANTDAITASAGTYTLKPAARGEVRSHTNPRGWAI